MVLLGEAGGGKEPVSPGVSTKLGAKQTPHGGNQGFGENTFSLSRLKAGLQEEHAGALGTCSSSTRPRTKPGTGRSPGQG